MTTETTKVSLKKKKEDTSVEFYTMELHEKLELANDIRVLRVIGGWIYTIHKGPEITACYVSKESDDFSVINDYTKKVLAKLHGKIEAALDDKEAMQVVANEFSNMEKALGKKG